MVYNRILGREGAPTAFFVSLVKPYTFYHIVGPALILRCVSKNYLPRFCYVVRTEQH